MYDILLLEECVNEMKSFLKKTIYRWYREFFQGNFTVEDASESGCPVERTTSEHITKMKQLIKDEEEILQIIAPTVHKISHDILLKVQNEQYALIFPHVE